MSLIYCNDLNCQRDTLVCIYNCKTNIKCDVYYKNYDKLQEEIIEDKYIVKYGEPKFPLPEAIIRKQKKEEKKLKLKLKIELEKEKLLKQRNKEISRIAKEKEKELKKETRRIKKLQKSSIPKKKTLSEIREKYGISSSLDDIFSSSSKKKGYTKNG